MESSWNAHQRAPTTHAQPRRLLTTTQLLEQSRMRQERLTRQFGDSAAANSSSPPVAAANLAPSASSPRGNASNISAGVTSMAFHQNASAPSLPSPAPSDETSASKDRSALSQSPNNMHVVAALSHATTLGRNQVQINQNVHNAHLQRRQHQAAAIAQNHVVPSSSAMAPPIPQFLTLDPSRQPGAVRSPGHPCAAPGAQSPASPLAGSPIAGPGGASRVPDGLLFNRLRAVERELAASMPSAVDNGRLQLLQDAVKYQDWFFQTLHQLFVLRMYSPASLPRSIRELNPECFAMIEAVLCPNSSCSPIFLKFAAEFPEPLMDIYSDLNGVARTIFENRVAWVKRFLLSLASKWPAFTREFTHERQAPPLVQDMVEQLGLESRVLHRVFFTTIARKFWEVVDCEEMTELIKIHELDAWGYHEAGHRRTQQEKNNAYILFKGVYLDYQLRKKDRLRAQQPYVVSSVLVSQFVSIPQSMQRAAPQVLPSSSMPISASPVQPQTGSTAAQQIHLAQMAQRRHQQQLQQSHRNSPNLARPEHSPISVQPGILSGLRDGINMFFNPPKTIRMFPPEGAAPRSQPTHPDTIRSALHQAHLRSPMLVPKEPEPSGARLYQHVVGYTLSPTIVDTRPIRVLKFHVAEDAIRRRPELLPSDITGSLPKLLVQEGSCTFRLRCSAMPSAAGFTTEHAWVTADNVWPEEMIFEVNGQSLDVRRKLHHGKYLPANLTQLLRAGENELTIFSNDLKRDRHKDKPLQYTIAVEAIGTISHNKIVSNIRRVSAPRSLDIIRKSLTADNHGDDDDDEIAVVSSALTINLFDPFTNSRIFDLPVRGAFCLHRDCFDLETFLSQCKRQRPGEPSVVDCWRCPLCRGDVRPQSLIVDEFLLQVRAELAAAGKLETRAIAVLPDGSWKPKEAPAATGVRSPSLAREEGAQSRSGSAVAGAAAPNVAANKVIEIIELD